MCDVTKNVLLKTDFKGNVIHFTRMLLQYASDMMNH